MLRERFAHININKCNRENSCFFYKLSVDIINKNIKYDANNNKRQFVIIPKILKFCFSVKLFKSFHMVPRVKGDGKKARKHRPP